MLSAAIFQQATKFQEPRKTPRRWSPRRYELLRRLALGLVFRAFCGILALDNARGLSAPAAQIVELGAAHLAAANDLDRIDHRRVKRKDALDAFAVGNLAHREVLVQPRSGAADAHAFVGLHTGAVAFDDLDVDDQRIPRLEIG